MEYTPYTYFNIAVIIPAFNEEEALPLVLKDIPGDLVRNVLVCDNGSEDQTAKVAAALGAIVISEPNRGYGSACLAGMSYLDSLPEKDQPDVVVFLDGDYSDFPEELPLLLEPIVTENADLVIGSRTLGDMEASAMTSVQRFGNWLAPMLIRIFFKERFTDLGPFRAIKWEKLKQLNMQDKNFGWTVEMQVKAAKQKMICREVPVRYRKRAAGHSKVSGTFKGAFRAGIKIIGTIFKEL